MEVKYPNGSNFPGAKPPQAGTLILIAVLALAFTSVGTLFYSVGPDEAGIIQRFGRFDRQTPPGLHVKLPFGIETVKKVPITKVFKEEFGFRTLHPGVRSTFIKDLGTGAGHRGEDDMLDRESLMLTGDLNVGDVEWVVHYRIVDPVQYLFATRNPRETLRNMSESVMRQIVGDHSINEVLTYGRESIGTIVRDKLQKVMTKLETGISVSNVVLQNVTPPDVVKPSFNEVNEAKQEKEKTINQAWEDYNHSVPRAKGLAEKMIREAEGYALDRVNRAQGDADRFRQIFESYKTNKDITRRRMYLEAMKATWPNVEGRYIIDDGTDQVLPLLQLGGLKSGGEKS